MTKQNVEKPKRRLGRWLLLAVLAVLALVGAHIKFIQAYDLQNGRLFAGRYRVLGDPWDHPRLKFLRKREHLDNVVASGSTEFEKIVLLRHWTRKQWESAPTFYYPPWDAVEILDLARKHKNYGFCAQYAMVFLQAVRSLGLHARYVDVGHFLTAVWSDDYNKWVIMDPTNDIYFEKDGVPMSGHALSEAAWSGNWYGIKKVSWDGKRTQVTDDDIQIYRKYSILLTNNQLTHPIEISDNGARRLLVHKDDYHQYPKVGRDNVGYGAMFLAWHSPGHPEEWKDRYESDDRDDFTYGMNQTIILVASKNLDQGIVKLRLFAESAPEWQAFSVKASNGSYTDSTGEVTWDLIPGVNTLSARVKTTTGWLGPESSIKVYYKPDWFSSKVEHLL